MIVEAVSDAALAAVVRNEAGLIVGSIHRQVRDFDIAEEAVNNAVVSALRAWRRDGAPDRPAAWLTVAARRNAVDLLRKRDRDDRLAHALADQLAANTRAPDQADERLPLLFACCNHALAVEARLALTLRAVIGLTTPQIARAFLVSETTLAQRIVRAKRKIVSAGIAMRVPPAEQLTDRLDDVLTVASLMYNEGYLAGPTGSAEQRQLAGDAVWLAELVARQLPKEPEAWGLLALLSYLEARNPARFDQTGSLVLLQNQDRSRWDQSTTGRAECFLDRAAKLRRPGRYQLQAAIAACHNAATTWDDTDWLQILTLYDLLVRHDRSPVVRLNRAIAVAHVTGPDDALAEIDALTHRLPGYQHFHSTRAFMLRQLGRDAEASSEDRQALALATNPVERALLRQRVDARA